MTINIRDVVDAPYAGIETYNNLLSLLNRASVCSTFWGKRYVYVKDMQGVYLLDDLYSRIYGLEKGDVVSGKPNFTAEERKIGLEIVNHVTKMAESTVYHPLAKVVILTGVLVHIEHRFNIVQIEHFHPRLIASGLIVMGATSWFLSNATQLGYTPTWHWLNFARCGAFHSNNIRT